MDINTINAILPIAEKHMTPAKYALFLKEMRTQYITSEIDIRKEYLKLKVRSASVTAQYNADIIKLEKQLATLV